MGLLLSLAMLCSMGMLRNGGNTVIFVRLRLFKAISMEVLGGFHETSVEVVQRLGQSLAKAGGQEEGEITRHLFGRLSIPLMHGSSALILSRTPTHPKPHINDYL